MILFAYLVVGFEFDKVGVVDDDENVLIFGRKFNADDFFEGTIALQELGMDVFQYEGFTKSRVGFIVDQLQFEECDTKKISHATEKIAEFEAKLRALGVAEPEVFIAVTVS